MTLSQSDRAILEFERKWWLYAGQKEQAIRDTFEIGATRYYQRLNALLEKPEALAFDAQLVKRLRKVRENRQRVRSARKLAG